jgi:hypothetical protein
MHDSEVMCLKKVDTPWSIYRDFTVYIKPLIQQRLAFASGCNVGSNFQGHIQATFSVDPDQLLSKSAKK